MLSLPQYLAFLSKRRFTTIVACFSLLLILTQISSFNKHRPPNIFKEPEPPIVLPPTPNLDDGKFHWQKLQTYYPVTSIIALPVGRPTPIPQIQHKFEKEAESSKNVRLERLATVKEAFQHAWKGYKDRAWMADEVAPLSGASYDFFGGWAASLVDALDTLWIMGMEDEFEKAVDAIGAIDFTTTEENTLNTFETTIRYMGGFLGAYDLSSRKYPVLLEKAMELGEMLLVAFDTPNRMPITRWDWKKARDGEKQEASTNTLAAEIGSLTLEFTRLTQITGDERYYDAVQRIMDHFDEQQNTTKLPGMWPVLVNARDLDFGGDTGYTLGAMADSLYEYLPKQHVLLGGRSEQYRKLYERAADVFEKINFFRPMTKDNVDILFSAGVHSEGDGSPPTLDPAVQHLVCFAGGMVGIAAKIFHRADDLVTARRLTDGCVWAYENMPNGLMTEVAHHVPCPSNDVDCTWDESKWHSEIMAHESDTDRASGLSYDERLSLRIQNERLPPGLTQIDDRRYILRPEAIESVFIMYRITGETTYQEKAWKMFEAIEKHTRTDIANCALDDVTASPPTRADRMESFWMAETLKYFYLVFADTELVSLDKYVFNTEAHPFRRPDW